MTLVRHNGGGLPSIEKARELLKVCRTDGEVRKIRAIAQAVATMERGKEIGCDASEIVFYADQRRAELEVAIRAERKEGRPKNGNKHVTVSKAQLVAEGRRAPLLTLPERDASRYFAACRKSLIPATSESAATLARLPDLARQKALAKMADDPKLAGAVKKLAGTLKLETKRDLAEDIRKNPIVTPDGRHQVIAIDPPWKYDTRAEDTTHRGKNLYPDMSVAEICALPVDKLAQKDCVLWLWTTNAFMRSAFQCLDAWGFKEKTILTWDKELLGLGDWLRNVTEHCILAVRGKPIVSLTNQTTIIREKRRQHSRKPEAFYKLVERLCPGSKLEMFARESRKGWATWGAESEKFDA